MKKIIILFYLCIFIFLISCKKEDIPEDFYIKNNNIIIKLDENINKLLNKLSNVKENEFNSCADLEKIKIFKNDDFYIETVQKGDDFYIKSIDILTENSSLSTFRNENFNFIKLNYDIKEIDKLKLKNPKIINSLNNDIYEYTLNNNLLRIMIENNKIKMITVYKDN